MAWLVRWFKWLIYPTSFTVASATATVSIWNPYQIEYTITPSNATNKKINWSSSNTAVATVDSKWVITAVSVWTCTITWVYSYDWTTRTISVTTSQVAVSAVSLDKNTMRVPMRWNWWLHATVYPANASNKNIIWTSSDDSIATVEWWLVKFKKNWNCTITATTEDWWFTDTCAVTCYIPAAWVYLDYDKLTITYWSTQSLTATVNPPNADDKSITWSSSDINVATVNDWVITYVTNWNCIITCTTVDWWHTATCKIISNNIPATWVTLNKHELTLVPWIPQQLTATISPSNVSNKNVTWTSSDTSKATVNSSWVVTYVAAWSCTITCTTVDWWFTDSCEVTCAIPVESVSLNKTSAIIVQWWTIQLVATINPSNATIQDVTRTSSNSNIAKVSPNWLVTFVALGNCTITVTTDEWWKTATCSISCQRMDQCRWYTWSAQPRTVPATWNYCIEVWWAQWWGSYWSNPWAKWWYAAWKICLTQWCVLNIYVWWQWWTSNSIWCHSWISWWRNWWWSWWWTCYSGWCSSTWWWWWWTDVRFNWSTLCNRFIVAWWWAWWGTQIYGGTYKYSCWWWGWTTWCWTWWWTQNSAKNNWGFWQWANAWANHTWRSTTPGWGWWWYWWWWCCLNDSAWGSSALVYASWWSSYTYTSSTCWNHPNKWCLWSLPLMTNAVCCACDNSFPTAAWWTETWHSWNWCVRIRIV